VNTSETYKKIRFFKKSEILGFPDLGRQTYHGVVEDEAGLALFYSGYC
jgi:hypothetical protein